MGEHIHRLNLDDPVIVFYHEKIPGHGCRVARYIDNGFRRHIPDLFDDFFVHMPYDCKLIGVEIEKDAHNICAFSHPERAIYLLGAEDNGLSSPILSRCQAVIQIPTIYCLNVAVAGSIVLYDRYKQFHRLQA